MKRWRHNVCGNITEFPAGVNPNKRQDPCPHCWVAVGSWVPA